LFVENSTVMNSSNAGLPTPFEWLSGGIFFGKKGGSQNEIDNCKDVFTLLKGVFESATQLFHEMTSEESLAQFKMTEAKEKTKREAEKLLSARLSRLRFLLYEERRQSSQTEFSRKPAIAFKTSEILTGKGTSNRELSNLMPALLKNLSRLPFESRKDISAIFSYLLQCGLDGADADRYKMAMKNFRDYVKHNFDNIMPVIVNNHDCGPPYSSTPDVVLHAGIMFRSCIKHLCLYEQLVGTNENVTRFVFPFIDKYVQSPNFDCASDSMESLKALLTGGVEGENNKDAQTSRYQIAAAFLERDYEAIWDHRFNAKLLSSKESNYLIRRMALQILSMVLLTRANYAVMVRYIANKKNLILVMLLLRDRSPHITLDAFNVFKIFVANPSKPQEIHKILSDNKSKLCTYLEGLHKEKEAKDSQFRDEKALVITTIQSL